MNYSSSLRAPKTISSQLGIEARPRRLPSGPVAPEDPDAFVKAIRSVTLAETPRGPVSFDDHGNVVMDVYVRRVDKEGGKMVNKTIKTYNNVSQFWDWPEKEYLARPVYSRTNPPLKSC